MKTILCLKISLLAWQMSNAGEIRKFTNTEGVTIQAELLDFADGIVKMRSGIKVYEVPLDKLSREDQDWLKSWDLARSGDAQSAHFSELIFEDDFSGSEFKAEWGHYKSKSEIKDGVLIGKTIDIDDHAGVDSIRFEGRRDMEVSVRFRFGGYKAHSFNVWFDDKDYAGSHAGHICNVSISPVNGTISDAKTGTMANEIYEKKKFGELDEATKALLETKKVDFRVPLLESRDQWHELLVRTIGDTVTVKVDGEEIGTLKSEGIAHETKSVVSLTTNESDVEYDDFVVRAAPVDSKPEGGSKVAAERQ